MNRRDIIIILLVLIWCAFVYFIIPTLGDIILWFAISLVVLDALMILLLILSFVIKRFGEWGDCKIFHKN